MLSSVDPEQPVSEAGISRTILVSMLAGFVFRKGGKHDNMQYRMLNAFVQLSDLQCTNPFTSKRTNLPSDTLVVYGSILHQVVSLLISSLQVLRS